MDIYENFVIGNFLYGLGVEMAHRHIGRPMPPTLTSLFQQTRDDEHYGDIIIKNPGIFRVLEFKREANRSYKEKAKLQMLEWGLQSSIFTPFQAEQLKAVSRKVHLYVEIPKGKSLVGNVRVTSYLDFEQPSERMDLAEFVRAVAAEASGTSKTEEDMEQIEWYLTFLCACRGSDSAALLILVTADGQLHYDPVSDIRDVLRPKRDILDRQMQHYQELVLEREAQGERLYERLLRNTVEPTHEREREHIHERHRVRHM